MNRIETSFVRRERPRLHGISLSNTVFTVCLMIALSIAFGGRVFLTSIDVVFHYVLTYEIGTFGYVRPEVASFPIMAVYPPASHWLAAIIGWIGGSDLVAVQLVLIAAIFFSYIFI